MNGWYVEVDVNDLIWVPHYSYSSGQSLLNWYGNVFFFLNRICSNDKNEHFRRLVIRIS